VSANHRDKVEPLVTVVTLPLCELCLSGAGGECHVPGCAMYLNRAPDLPVREKCQRPGPRGACGMSDSGWTILECAQGHEFGIAQDDVPIRCCPCGETAIRGAR
jgi:hypothetical protein